MKSLGGEELEIWNDLEEDIRKERLYLVQVRIHGCKKIIEGIHLPQVRAAEEKGVVS